MVDFIAQLVYVCAGHKFFSDSRLFSSRGQTMKGWHEHLPRLDRRYYQGQAYVHWTLGIQDRRIGWLKPIFYYKFRELLTHTASRFWLTCPIFCLMPDHMHMLWLGRHPSSDQIEAMKHLRKHLKKVLSAIGFELQHQPYDHVLRDDERMETAFENLVDYIARNPERKRLVPLDGFAKYPYTNCIVPGYPEFRPFMQDFWPRFWRCYNYSVKNQS